MTLIVIPAQAGIQDRPAKGGDIDWIPAFAGMTQTGATCFRASGGSEPSV
jgi:hypothetical protein